MKWHWVIQNDRSVKNPLIVGSDHLGVDPDTLKAGASVANWGSEAELNVTEPADDGTPDDAVQNHLGLLVFSERLRTAIELNGLRGFQFLPVTIVRSSGSRLSNFAIANIVEKRTALDLKRSDYDVFPDDYFIAERRGRIRSVRTAALRSEALPDADAFRLEEFPSRLFASERFVRVFDDMRCTGLSFVEAHVVSGSKIATEH